MPETPLTESELQDLVQELITDADKGETSAFYSLLGIYLEDWSPEVIKCKIIDFFEKDKYIGKDFTIDMELGQALRMKQWQERWKKRNAWDIVMKKNAFDDELPDEWDALRERVKESLKYLDLTNPSVLQNFLDMDAYITNRMFSNVPLERAYQEAFMHAIDYILPIFGDDEKTLVYLEKIVEIASQLNPPIELTVPVDIRIKLEHQEQEKTEQEEQTKTEREKQQRKERGELTLEEQLADAIAEERYEDASEIKRKLDRLKRIMGNYEDTLSIHKQGVIIEQDNIIIHADNLDLVQPDKPYDNNQPDQLRQRHRKRFRNEPGGSDEGFMEGLDGTKNMDRGIGSDQHSDVGSPASINLASKKDSIWKNRVERRKSMGLDPYSVDEIRAKFRKKEKKIVSPAPNMPNEKMERDPQEEKATTDTWREFNDMEQR